MKTLGSLFLLMLSGIAYAGFTTFPVGPVAANSIVTKGGILSNNGTNQSEFSACADGNVLEYLGTASEGLKCGVKTVNTNTNAGTICTGTEYLAGDGTCDPQVVNTNTNAGTICTAGQFLNGDGSCDGVNYAASVATGGFNTTSAAFQPVTFLTVTITTTGNPVDVYLAHDSVGVTFFGNLTGDGQAQIVRGGSVLALTHVSSSNNGLPPRAFDVVAAGTHTYTVQVRAISGTTTFDRFILIAREIK